MFLFLKQARVERMEEFQQKGEEINKGLVDCRRKLAETQRKLKELNVSTPDDAKTELSKVQAEEKKLKKEERDWEKKVDEHNREEKKMPWNVDTLSKEGFSKVSNHNARKVAEMHSCLCCCLHFCVTIHISKCMTSVMLFFCLSEHCKCQIRKRGN